MDAALKDRAIVVTGAGKGLGRAYALRLAAAGAAVVVNNRWADRGQPSSADAVVGEIAARGGRAVACHAAAEDPDSGAALVRCALDAFGRLDGLIANAGVPESASFGRQSLADFRRVFDINFLGTLHAVHAAWPVMLAQRYGRVVVSTSSAGLHGNRGMPAYAASKAALIGLTRALALEGARADVRINAIAPYAATAMTAAHIDPATAARMPAEAVAPAAAWLASPACDLSGEVFIVGAGRVRGARMVEGPAAEIGADPAAALHRVAGNVPVGAFASANDAFQAFLAESALG
jgi:NAD(P)-dependent dehydrogenase (short-subunit alcohol dehydrogenase family)